MVDAQGAVPNKADDQSVPFIVHNTGDGETGSITVGNHPPICLPDVNACDQTPRPSPAVFTYCKYWQLEWPGNEATKTLC